MLTCKEAAAILRGWDDILVVCHANPDGDALGSMTALTRGLRALGRRADWHCADPIPAKFAYLFEGLENTGFAPAHTVTVDVADQTLLGSAWEQFGEKIELAIDHHGTHKPFAPQRWVDPASAATAEMVWLLLGELGAPVDRETANSIYTGIATDTGCFRFRNTTPRTHQIAAQLMEQADWGDVNQRMFETKTRAQVEAERLVMESVEFFCGDRAALVQVPLSIYERTGAQESDLEGVSGLVRQTEGVLIGVTIKEKPDGSIKVSLRTNPPADASAVCGRFGGGGHQGAAGCKFESVAMAEAAERMKTACQQYLAEIGCS